MGAEQQANTYDDDGQNSSSSSDDDDARELHKIDPCTPAGGQNAVPASERVQKQMPITTTAKTTVLLHPSMKPGRLILEAPALQPEDKTSSRLGIV